jgi:hypothetical protein
MSSSPWQKPLAELAAVLGDLSKESDALNAAISEFEQALVAINPGIAVWCAKPIRVREVLPFIRGSQLGFMKGAVGWGLYIRRGRFVKSGNGWEPASSPDFSSVKLIDATREERVEAIELFTGLVEAIKLAAQEHLESVKRARPGAR